LSPSVRGATAICTSTPARWSGFTRCKTRSALPPSLGHGRLLQECESSSRGVLRESGDEAETKAEEEPRKSQEGAEEELKEPGKNGGGGK
jgi:hypothetical protein